MDDVPRLPASKPTLPPSSPAHLASAEARVAHRTWIGGAVKTLLLIYDSFPSDPLVQAEQGKMWADDLEWFPRHVIDLAITEYRV